MSGKGKTLRLFKYSDKFQTFRHGDVIFTEGESGKIMYVVKSGSVELSTNGVVVETVETGDILGEMALLDNHCRSATATALTDCQIVPIDMDYFSYLVRQTPNFALEVMQVMSARLRRMDLQKEVLRRNENQGDVIQSVKKSDKSLELS